METKELGRVAKKEYVKPILSKYRSLTVITFTSGTTTGGGTKTGTSIPGAGGSPGTVL